MHISDMREFTPEQRAAALAYLAALDAYWTRKLLNDQKNRPAHSRRAVRG